jgi:hypothetical protein
VADGRESGATAQAPGLSQCLLRTAGPVGVVSLGAGIDNGRSPGEDRIVQEDAASSRIPDWTTLNGWWVLRRFPTRKPESMERRMSRLDWDS